MDDIESIAWECSKNDGTLIVDEAFGDYVDECFSAVNLLTQYENVAVTRTFSKGMGVAQVRIGYGILSAELGRLYDRVDVPSHPVSTIAASLAIETLRDGDFVGGNRSKISVQKKRLTKEVIRRGYSVAETCDSCPIFLLGHRDEGVDLGSELLKKGISTASGSNFDNLSPNYVRVNSPAHAEDLLSRVGS